MADNLETIFGLLLLVGVFVIFAKAILGFVFGWDRDEAIHPPRIDEDL